MRRFLPAVQLGLFSLLALLISDAPALADVCKQVRPSWDPADGPVSIYGEAFKLLFSGGGIFLMGATALAVKTKNFWFSAVVAVGWLAIAGIYYWVSQNPVGIDVEARALGCIGSPNLAIGLFVVFGAVLFIWQVLNSRKEQNERA